MMTRRVRRKQNPANQEKANKTLKINLCQNKKVMTNQEKREKVVSPQKIQKFPQRNPK
jgi:hypothetical protein